VLQNHLMQVAILLTMEPPAGGVPNGVREEKVRAVQAMLPLDPAAVVRGQYRGYQQVAGVAPDSDVETFAAVRLYIDTWRWAGVPLYIRTGKCLPMTVTEALVELKRPPQAVFGPSELIHPNYLRFRLSPTVETALLARSKVPGEAMIGHDVELLVHSDTAEDMLPYERLLSGAMCGDHTLFATEAGVEAAWRVIDPALADMRPPEEYQPGTWGPAADTLITPEGHWYTPIMEPAG
jgi:glucose-6-phosphate 1-dehydrogenase